MRYVVIGLFLIKFFFASTGQIRSKITPYFAVWGLNYVDFFILMPSGVKHNSQYEVNVSECGTKLFLSIVWPRHTTDKTILVKVAQKNDPGLTELSPRAAGLNASFRQLTDKLGQNVEMTYYMNVLTTD